MKKKLLDFQTNISDVKQINPLFSTAKARILYTGKNRNLSYITKSSVEKALPTLANIPVVGEFSEENKDYKGHGGAIDLDSYKYIHTTKPYGVVPESATYEWEEVKGNDGVTREYLVINGIYLWTGRYKEAFSVIEKGKGQSMEIEVTDGRWDEEEEIYKIDNFNFSALCILGDDVEPAFEDANITAYSLDKNSFKQEFSIMLKELKNSLSKEKEVENMGLKELLEKYSLKIEDVTSKGIKVEDFSLEDLEAKIIEIFEIDVKEEEEVKDETVENEDGKDEKEAEEDVENTEEDAEKEKELDSEENAEEIQDSEEDEKDAEGTDEDSEEDSEDAEKVAEKVDYEAKIKDLENKLDTATSTINDLTVEVESLREFKLDTEKLNHKAKAEEIFSNFQLTEEDIKDINIHEFSIEQLEEKCYAILGRKMAKKNFSKQKDNKEKGIRLSLIDNEDKEDNEPYGGLFSKYKKD